MCKTLGDVELLETDTTRYEVLPGGREPHSEATAEFYAGLFRGKGWSLTKSTPIANDRCCRGAIEILFLAAWVLYINLMNHFQPIVPIHNAYRAMVCTIETPSVLLFSIEVISGDSEFINHDTTQMHQVIETFLQCVVDSRAFYSSVSANVPETDPRFRFYSYHKSGFADSSSLPKDVVLNIHKIQLQHCKSFSAIQKGIEDLGILLHNHISQCITQRMTLFFKLKRRCCITCPRQL